MKTLNPYNRAPDVTKAMLAVAAVLIMFVGVSVMAGVANADTPAIDATADAAAASATATTGNTVVANINKGYEIAARSDRSDRGFNDSSVQVTMVLRNRAGKEIERVMQFATLEIPDENVGDKSLIVFDTPADIEGTALLSHAKILDPDDQWLYLPALKRVKRISSVNKSGPFVGSEFAFEDFTALELNKYEYKYIGEEACGNFTCDVIERKPRYEHSGYKRQLTWVDQDVYQVRVVEFYDRRGGLLKTLSLEDYREYDGGVWRSHQMLMVNHQTGKETDLVYTDFEFKNGVKDKDFVKSVLTRLR